MAREENKVGMEEWAKFRERLIGLTDVTKSHFEKLVQVSSPQDNAICLHKAHLKACEGALINFSLSSAKLSRDLATTVNTHIDPRLIKDCKA